MISPNVLFVYKNPKAEDPTVCHAGLAVTAANLTMSLRESRTLADYKPVVNGEYLWGKLSSDWKAVTHVVLMAPYIDAAFMEKMVSAFPAKRFVIVYHSNLGFLSVDQFAGRSIYPYLQLSQRAKNFTLAANSIDLSRAITAASGVVMEYLPNIYHLPHLPRRQKDPWQPPMELHVGLFGAARVLKNWLSAAMATMVLQRRVGVNTFLHLNSGRDEGAAGTRNCLADMAPMNPNVTLVDVPWLSADDFGRYLYGMDLLLQPSYSETFNNVTADGAARGVPSVVSNAITWAPAEWKARADSAMDIADTAWNLLHDKAAALSGWAALDSHNRDALKIWKQWLAVPAVES